MKLHHRVLTLLMATALAFTLTACDPMQTARDMVVSMVRGLGLVAEPVDDEAAELHAEQGGSITFPEGMDTSNHFNTLLQDGTLYIEFDGISVNRLGNTDYFTAAGNSVTITGYGATDESLTSIDSYKVALWELSEDSTRATYVQGSTIYIDFSADETCYSHVVNGLTAGRRYKATISFDSSVAEAVGGVTISGLTNDELVSTETGSANAA